MTYKVTKIKKDGKTRGKGFYKYPAVTKEEYKRREKMMDIHEKKMAQAKAKKRKKSKNNPKVKQLFNTKKNKT